MTRPKDYELGTYWPSTSLEILSNIVFVLEIPVSEWYYDSELQPLGKNREYVPILSYNIVKDKMFTVIHILLYITL